MPRTALRLGTGLSLLWQFLPSLAHAQTPTPTFTLRPTIAVSGRTDRRGLDMEVEVNGTPIPASADQVTNFAGGWAAAWEWVTREGRPRTRLNLIPPTADAGATETPLPTETPIPTDTPGPTPKPPGTPAAPSGLADVLANISPLCTTSTSTGIPRQFLNVTWSYTDGPLPAEGFELVATSDGPSASVTQRLLLGPAAREAWVQVSSVTASQDISLRAFRITSLGMEFSGAVSITPASGGANCLIFRTIAVSGQSDVVADSPIDTLTLIAGSGVTITTDVGADSVTFSAALPATSTPTITPTATPTPTAADTPTQTPTQTPGVVEVLTATPTPFQMSAGRIYVVNTGVQATLTLPTSCAVGDQFEVVGKGAGGWKLAQGSGQQISLPWKQSTSGTGGYVASLKQYDQGRFVCIATTGNWVCSPCASLQVF